MLLQTKHSTIKNKRNLYNYTIIKQSTSTITERAEYRQGVKIEGKQIKEKKDNYYSTNTLFNLI